MLHSVKKLEGCGVRAANGDVGKVTDVYFDDQAWTARYFVVDTGGWLNGRSVLISPMAVSGIEPGERRIDLMLNRERVENAPGIDTNLPVGRRLEAEYYRYYGWPNYWAGGGLWGPSSTPLGAAGTMGAGSLDVGAGAVPTGTGGTEAYPPPPNEPDGGDMHLRSAREVVGYRVLASDGQIGNVVDLVVDDANWSIGQIVIDTTRWLPGGEVVIDPQHIQEVNWAERSVVVDLDRETVKNSPHYRPGEV